jgi:hypothetical protein
LTGTFRQGRMAPDHAQNACRRHCERLGRSITATVAASLLLPANLLLFRNHLNAATPQPHAVQRFADAR